MPTPADRPPGAASPPIFKDGFGTRWLAFDQEHSDPVELLAFERSLVEAQGFAAELGVRVARLASARHALYARARRVDRPSPDALLLISDRVPGWRLSDILQTSQRESLKIDISAVLGVLRQLIPAVALFARHQKDLAVGSIGPERLILTPHGRLVLSEYVLGPAVEKLQFTRERLWKELRVAVPAVAGVSRITPKADVVGIGVVALSLLLGRTLTDDEYPTGLVKLIEESKEWSNGTSRPLSEGLGGWLGRALHTDGRTGFQTPQEAQVAFEEVLARERGYVTTPAILEAFVSKYQGIVGPPAQPEAPAAEPIPPPAPPPPVVKAEPPPPVVEKKPAAAPKPTPPPESEAVRGARDLMESLPGPTPNLEPERRPGPRTVAEQLAGKSGPEEDDDPIAAQIARFKLPTSAPTESPGASVGKPAAETPEATTAKPAEPAARKPAEARPPQADAPGVRTFDFPSPTPAEPPKVAKPAEPPRVEQPAPPPRAPETRPEPPKVEPSAQPRWLRAPEPTVESPKVQPPAPTPPTPVSPPAATPRPAEAAPAPRPAAPAPVAPPATTAPVAPPAPAATPLPAYVRPEPPVATPAAPVAPTYASAESAGATLGKVDAPEQETRKSSRVGQPVAVPSPAPVTTPDISGPVHHDVPGWIKPALGLLTLLVLLEAGVIGWLFTRGGSGGGGLGGDGELVVQSRPTAARVTIDGEDKGVTPVTVQLSPGAHTMEVRAGRAEPRVITLQIRAGVQTAQYVELLGVAMTGALEVRSDPGKARVTILGQYRGVTPLTIRDLPPGEHEVVLEANGREVRQKVRIEPGGTAQLIVPMRESK